MNSMHPFCLLFTYLDTNEISKEKMQKLPLRYILKICVPTIHSLRV